MSRLYIFSHPAYIVSPSAASGVLLSVATFLVLYLYFICPPLHSLSSSLPALAASLGAYATLASTLCAIAADIIAIAITWIKTYRHVREASSVHVRFGFGASLLQYGTLFFILPNVILSRFLLNLRQIDAPEVGSSPGHVSRFSVPNFRMPTVPSIIGNLGEPLAYAEELEGIVDAEHADSEASEVGSSAVWNSGEGGGSPEVPNVDTIEIKEVPVDLV
ncbi:hypothetical protein NM688_g3520 [Phlebia brevispora]|uniref:Uncharacterized protein n=1 Tax=Phlebia brevispora TaxID=194682 RepID=A0ACC1T5J9_9APHY|nr:hypothetical protein NM688_g3520 [Phlebia brevispora]